MSTTLACVGLLEPIVPKLYKAVSPSRTDPSNMSQNFNFFNITNRKFPASASFPARNESIILTPATGNAGGFCMIEAINLLSTAGFWTGNLLFPRSSKNSFFFRLFHQTIPYLYRHISPPGSKDEINEKHCSQQRDSKKVSISVPQTIRRHRFISKGI